MLEQTFADQVATAAQKAGSAAVNPGTNIKKRKAEANAFQQAKDLDDFDDLYYSNGKGKKPKGGIGYAGNMREDVVLHSLHQSYSLITKLIRHVGDWSRGGLSCPKSKRRANWQSTRKYTPVPT